MIRFRSAGLQTLNLEAGEVVRPRKVVEQPQPARRQAVRPVRFRMPGAGGDVPTYEQLFARERLPEGAARPTYSSLLAKHRGGR